MTLSWLQTLFARELRAFSRELDLFPTEDLIWATLPGVSNSAGTLALHVSGNLQHFIGAVLGGTGYVRNRAHEFSARNIPRAELQAELQRASDAVSAVLPNLPEATLETIYPDILGGPRIVTGLFLIHLSGHLAFHLGQVGYLRRALTGESISSGVVALSELSIAAPGAGD